MEEFSILINEEFITEMESKYPKLNIKFGYGTCGFRTKSDTLENVCFRSGIIAALRSKCVGQICGNSFPIYIYRDCDNSITQWGTR